MNPGWPIPNRPVRQLLALVVAAEVLLLAVALGLAQPDVLAEAVSLIRAERFAEARDVLVPYVQTNASDLSAQYWLGRAHLGAGQLSDAIEVFQGVLARKPSSVDTRLWLAKALYKDNQSQAARRELNKVLAVRPNDPEATQLTKLLRVVPAAEPGPAVSELGAVEEAGKGRVTLVTGGLPIEPGSVNIYSANLSDYTFGCAPVDWVVSGGHWESTSRWTCQPQWSWYGGYNQVGPATIWNKRQFAGDLVVELYGAFKMGFGVQGRNYKNPNDINITICGDGANLDSGYTFMVGGERNTTTRIMKGTQILAQTGDNAALFPIFENGFPGSDEFHRKWWGIMARKRGSRLQLYLDNELVCEAQDPQPLNQGQVAIWTYNNGIIIPRIKVYYEHEIQRPMRPAGQPALIVPQRTVAAPVVRVSSSSHPTIYNDFENDLGTFENRDGSDGALLTLCEGGADGGGHCLRLINQRSGGTFAATIYEGEFDVAKFGKLAFDYKLSAGVKVNLYLTVDEQLYEIVFAGRSRPAPRARILGHIDPVQADNQWHRAHFDLLGHLQVALGRWDNIQAKDLFLGNLNDTEYLRAGFGGNHTGTDYYLDNFALATPSASATVKLTLRPTDGTQPAGYAISINDQPLASPGEKVTTDSAQTEVEASGAGRWYVHIRPRLDEGQWGPVMHYPVWIDDEGPHLAQSSPPGGVLDDQPVEIGFVEPGGSGLDLSTLQLQINEKDYDAGSPAIRYQPNSERLLIDPRLLGLTFDDNSSFSLIVKALEDRAGNSIPEPIALSWTVQWAVDHHRPQITEVMIGDGYLCYADFERDLGSLTAYGGDESALLFRDDSTAATGRYSLKVYNSTEAGRFGLYIRKQPFDAGKYRLVAFDYKIPPRLRADFALFVNGEWKGVQFTDVGAGPRHIGQVPDVVADNEWHYAEFNLYKMLRQDDPSAANYIVNQFVLADWGWQGNARGQTYHLDNFAIIPVISGTSPLPVVMQALDISGIGGVGWSLSNSREGQAPRQAMADSVPVELADTGDFDGWLHVRAQDPAGHWSESQARRLLTDSRLPRASRMSPAAEARVADSEVKIALLDDGVGGIDPTSVVLTVGGNDYEVDNQALRYDSQERILSWNCEKVRPEPVVFEDGQPVTVTLTKAADFAGNLLTKPLQWTWIMDYAHDHQPPVPTVQSSSHPTVMSNTFEEGLGTAWRLKQKPTVVQCDDSTSASGKYSLKLTKEQGGQLRAGICRKPYPAEKYPVISFDYKIPSGTQLGLLASVGGRWYGFAITGKTEHMVGAVPGVVADDQWHHAVLTIDDPLRKQIRRGPMVVEQLVITDRNESANKSGAVAHLDNFVIGQVGTGPISLTWTATDTTGIAGYSHTLNQKPDTIPSAVSNGSKASQGSHEFAAQQPGVWFFHLRAQDGAGNWGPTVHYAILNGTQ